MVKDTLDRLNINPEKECTEIEAGIHGIVSRVNKSGQTEVKLVKIDAEKKVGCLTYIDAIVYDLRLMRTRIERIFEFLMYFKAADERPSLPVEKLNCLATDAMTFSALPSYFNEGVRMYLNKKFPGQYEKRVRYEIESHGIDNCSSPAIHAMGHLSQWFLKNTVSTPEKRTNGKTKSVSLVRIKRGIDDWIFGNPTQSEIVENININARNIEELSNWTEKVRGYIQYLYDHNNFSVTPETITNFSDVVNLDSMMQSFVMNLLILKSGDIQKTLSRHTSLLNLERLEGNLLRAVENLSKGVTGRSQCTLSFGTASCTKGKPTVQIDDQGVLHINSIQEKVELKKTTSYSCVPVERGVSWREGASIIHQSTDGKILLSNGKMVNKKPDSEEFRPVQPHELPKIGDCFFNSDYNQTYLISCSSRTYITLSGHNLLLKELEVLTFREKDFPLKIGHNSISSQDIKELINVVSGVKAAKKLTIEEDYSPIVFGHIIEEFQANSTETRFMFDFPALVREHPSVLHYVSISSVFLGILAIILLIFLLRIIVKHWQPISRVLGEIFLCKWLVRFIKDDDEKSRYLTVATAPPDNSFNMSDMDRFNEEARMINDLLDRQNILRDSISRTQNNAVSEQNANGPNRDETREGSVNKDERKQREVAKAKRILDRYGQGTMPSDPSGGAKPPAKT